jgi:hypothetical protein
VQRQPAGPRVAAGAQDDGGLQPAEPGPGRADLDRTVLPAELDVAEDPAPEPREQFSVGAGRGRLPPCSTAQQPKLQSRPAACLPLFHKPRESVVSTDQPAPVRRETPISGSFGSGVIRIRGASPP